VVSLTFGEVIHWNDTDLDYTFIFCLSFMNTICKPV